MPLRQIVEAYVRARPDEALERVLGRGRPERVAGLSLQEIDSAALGLLRSANRSKALRTLVGNAAADNLLIDALTKELARLVRNARPFFEDLGYKAIPSDNEVGFRLVKEEATLPR